MTDIETYPDWRDSSWPWMAKLDRAGHHIGALSEEVSAFHASAYRVSHDPGDNPSDIVLRLHIAEPIPVRFST
ncbi:MAG TPA: hypothetical protein VNU19_16175, partial [Candidatus Acidoferrum sp.]|nr:hypothetical protein [Candidatus Acidoferrum sp.]